MDTIENYRQLIRKILTEQTKVPYAHGDIQFETVFDRESDRYLVMILGRENKRRVHGCLIHVDIIYLDFIFAVHISLLELAVLHPTITPNLAPD